MSDENKYQRTLVWNVIRSGQWLTLFEIRSRLPGMHSEAGISARLRDFRKAKFGGHTILRRKRAGCPRTFEYCLAQQELFAREKTA